METTDLNMILLLGETLLLLVLLICCFGILLYLIRVQHSMETLIAMVQKQYSISITRPADHPLKEKDNSFTQAPPIPENHAFIDILEDRTDIRRNMEALSKKYGLMAITIASPDGLVVASSDPDASTIAAKYSHMNRTGAKPQDPRVQLFEMHYRGSPLIGIIRGEHPLSPAWLSSLEEDAKKILNVWLP